MTTDTKTMPLAWQQVPLPPHRAADGDAIHNPWSPEWNHPQHSSFWHDGDMTRCACGIFTPPALVPALAAMYPKSPTRGGLCSATLENHEFSFVWYAPG